MPSLDRHVAVLLPLVVLAFLPSTGSCQIVVPFKGADEGLSEAVRWKWTVSRSPDADWGLALPEPPPALPANATPVPVPADMQGVYTVKRGDALITIAKRHKITVDQLKFANGLSSNLIRAGDQLKIPTPEEIARMPAAVAATPTPPPKPARPGDVPVPASGFDADTLLLQIYLDRLGFSPGPIDGRQGLRFQKLMYAYQQAHQDAQDPDTLRAKAKETVGDLFSSYTLRAEDFRFIEPPKAERAAVPTPVPDTKKKGKPSPAPTPVPRTYADLISGTMSAYRSPWAFVAERFHCDEAFLKSLNPSIKTLPVAGTKFQVPNVTPFEIESVFARAVQPPADPAQPVTAAIVDLGRIEVTRGGVLVAAFPVSAARPGLRGKGTWTVLTAIPRPRLATKRELHTPPKPPVALFGAPSPTPVPTPPPLAIEEFIPAGPGNPAGIFWINLAKSGSQAALPYGLHGSGSPSTMFTRESIGGFRLTNWDIARLVRLLPVGTTLEWKESAPPAVAPARAVPAGG